MKALFQPRQRRRVSATAAIAHSANPAKARPRPVRAGAGAAVLVHVPSRRSQRSSAPLHAVSQQTPSVQNVDAHTAPLSHAAPFGFGVGVTVAVAVTVGVAVTVAVGVQVAGHIGCCAPPHPKHCMLTQRRSGSLQLSLGSGQHGSPASPHSSHVPLSQTVCISMHPSPMRQHGLASVPQSWQVPSMHPVVAELPEHWLPRVQHG